MRLCNAKVLAYCSDSLPLLECFFLDKLSQWLSACTEQQEAEGLQSELEWMSEMTEDEYNELTPRTRHDIDNIRLQLNKERLRKYFTSHLTLCVSPANIT